MEKGLRNTKWGETGLSGFGLLHPFLYTLETIKDKKEPKNVPIFAVDLGAGSI